MSRLCSNFIPPPWSISSPCYLHREGNISAPGHRASQSGFEFRLQNSTDVSPLWNMASMPHGHLTSEIPAAWCPVQSQPWCLMAVLLPIEPKEGESRGHPQVFLGRNTEQRRIQKLGSPTCPTNSRKPVCENTLLRRTWALTQHLLALTQGKAGNAGGEAVCILTSETRKTCHQIT